MLDPTQRRRLLDQLGLPDAGRQLVLDAVRHAPVRPVASRGGGNVVHQYQSLKMQRTLDTESRHLEFPAAVSHEHDPAVLEYYPQPCRLRFDLLDAHGDVHAVDHTPDFLVLTEAGAWLEEWKPRHRLERLAGHHPWRYRLDPDGRWRAPGLEAWLAERGLGYRLCTEDDIPQRRVENILLLEDYLDPDAPPCPVDIARRVQDALACDAVLPLAELYDRLPCRPEDLFKLIADGRLVADIDHASLAEPARCRVFRDLAVRDFEHARRAPVPLALDGSVDIAAGVRLTYDQRPYTVTLVGARKVVLEAADGQRVEIGLDSLEGLVRAGDVRMADAPLAPAPVGLADFTEAELNQALGRLGGLEHVRQPNRSQRRYLKALALARLAGTDELVALVPRVRDRGNRSPRLTQAQEDAMDEVIRSEYLSHRAPNVKHCHRSLCKLCAERGIPAPSYPTLIERIKALPRQGADRARHGNRVAYQNGEFVDVLYADTPVHGSRAFQYVHMDHTELDIELVSLRTGKPIGRPWLSLAVDAHTRRLLGLYLSFDPPSYRANMMLLRDMVRRYRRLPQFIIVDNGADFRSGDFQRFCERLRIHLRYRPAGRPRHGAVLERLFGRLHSEYVHNLAGNTKALRNVRQTTGKYLPSRLAEWTLEALYHGLDYWAFTYYDESAHPSLGLSPREAFERSVQQSGERQHRIVNLTRDFLVLTCPTVDRKGQRKVDRQRGVKVHHHYYYWCPEFSAPRLHGQSVPVRYDPWDAATVHVQVDGRWVAAHCKALVGLGRLTEKERELFSGELFSQGRLAEAEAVTAQRLAEFMRTFTPRGALALALERQHDNRSLYGPLGLGAIAGPAGPGLVDATARPDWYPSLHPDVYPDAQPDPLALAGPQPSPAATPAPAATPYPVAGESDAPEFDTF